MFLNAHTTTIATTFKDQAINATIIDLPVTSRFPKGRRRIPERPCFSSCTCAFVLYTCATFEKLVDESPAERKLVVWWAPLMEVNPSPLKKLRLAAT